MDEKTLERAKQRLAGAAEGRLEAAKLEAALERSRAQLEALTLAAAELESSLPDRVGRAVEEGFRREALPVGRQVAEIRGLLNAVVRRLDELEAAVTAERHARLDDLALLVDLVSSGWRSVEERLGQLERAGDKAEVVPISTDVAAA